MSGATTAITEAKRRNASLIIWGDYDLSDASVIVTMHIQLLNLESGMTVDVPWEPVAPILDLQTYSIQKRLATHSRFLALSVVGIVNYRKHKFEQAIPLFREALGEPVSEGENLDKATTNFYLGTSCLNSNQLDCAAQALDQAVLTNPHLIGARLNRGITYHRLGQFSLAKRDCQSDFTIGSAR